MRNWLKVWGIRIEFALLASVTMWGLVLAVRTVIESLKTCCSF
jgi:hypothetical protein